MVILIGAALTRYAGTESIIHIREGQKENYMISLEPYLQITITDNNKTYYKEYQFDLSALGGNDFNYNIEFADKSLNVKFKQYLHSKKGNSEMGLLKIDVTLDNKTQEYSLVGKRGMQGKGELKQFNNTKIYIEYGSKGLTLPFSIYLRDFQLDRYPGSMAPSSYASEITLIDDKKGVKFDYRIYMNHILTYGNYRFYQSSYDPDEHGTVLSVNNDPGKWPTYIGYLILIIGLVWNMFDKKSRFTKLTQYIKQFNSFILVVLLGFSINIDLKANDTKDTVKYLQEFKDNSLTTADKFGHLIVQAGMGRMKPIDTLSMEILNKISRKSSFMGMNHNQVILGMMSHPDIWRNIKMIKIKTPKLKKFLGISKDRKYVAFSELFEQDNYKLKILVEKANSTPPNKRGTFENDIIKLDERLNIAYMVYFGNLFNIFPKPNDPTNKWYNPLDAINSFDNKTRTVIETMLRGFINSVVKNQWDSANKYIDLISAYQKKVGATVMPKQSVIDNEVLFNKLSIFPKLTIAYVSLGFILFIIAFVGVFNKRWLNKKVNTTFFLLLTALFLIQTIGMGIRWYISGHAPWSNTYESLVYIAWSAMFAGLIFFRKSTLALSATVIMAGVFMFTAHLSGIDPQITNLVPVLKSYWLTIHVSIITGSYGFLGIGAVLGFMSMLLFIFRDKNKPHIDQTIKHITAINEAALILGLAMLIVGNFIGGVWANESWGRYWGWDPKETWAWVSIIVYAFVLHLRFIKKLDNPWIFSVVSTVAFASIIMTYFGVNFYLSGMHSYATGDPVPVPAWVYILTIIIFSVIALSSKKRDIGKLKL
jgi:cytochrome c-type biogenesis protein CcsB